MTLFASTGKVRGVRASMSVRVCPVVNSKIVWDRGMRVGEVVCREAILVAEAVQVGHRGISDDVGVIGIFLDEDEDMAEADALTGRRWSPGDLSNATGLANTQKENASNRNRAADRMCKRDAYIFLDLSIEFFLENSAGELLRKARTTLLRHPLILAYSLVSVCPVWDTHAGRKGGCS